MRAFRSDGQRQALETAPWGLSPWASPGADWQVELEGGETLKPAWVVLGQRAFHRHCWSPGMKRPWKAVLASGGAAAPACAPAFGHCGAVVWARVNLIARPDEAVARGPRWSRDKSSDPRAGPLPSAFRWSSARLAAVRPNWWPLAGLRARPIGSSPPLLRGARAGAGVGPAGTTANGILWRRQGPVGPDNRGGSLASRLTRSSHILAAPALRPSCGCRRRCCGSSRRHPRCCNRAPAANRGLLEVVQHGFDRGVILLGNRLLSWVE